ncbi:MAG: phosphoribosylaminoimidazole carboxylase, ATPase subunit [Chthonomonadales bacterium]|nr:phosphoribosylaminoimidazole carboxylase, ATPase subunit [Chthonomonadales bacterium]
MIIGILGGGQLGRMLALAGYPLGLEFRFLDPNPDAPMRRLAEQVTGDYSDVQLLRKFAEGLDLVTWEFENVPLESAHFLEQRVEVYPPPAALEAGQDRLIEKTFFKTEGVPTTAFLPVESLFDLEDALVRIGLPSVLKTRRMGYDGKGQAVLRQKADIKTAWDALGGIPLLLEAFVPFQRELSLIGVRGRDGEMVFYPLVENHHKEGILHLTLAPAPRLTQELQDEASNHLGRVMEALDYVGVMAMEFFEVNGKLLANEMAPRVHNSGHWTIECAETSQFENHLRAIAGLPLGDTEAVGCAAMVNLIGEVPDPADVLGMPDTHLHLYGKESRPGRKLGHITLRAEDEAVRDTMLLALKGFLPGVDW